VLTAGFGWVMQAYGFTIIDEIAPRADVSAMIASYTDTQRTAHFWMTLGLDILYPLVYGAFFAGMALRFFGRAGPWLAIPAMLVVPVDIAENIIQLFALSGNEAGLFAKEYLTPLKMTFFFSAILIALAGLFTGIGRRLLPQPARGEYR